MDISFLLRILTTAAISIHHGILKVENEDMFQAFIF